MSQNGAINELGTERIGKLLTQYAVPAIIAMTASSLYNMVDSIFIGHGVGPLAISGLAVTFPLMNLAAAFGSLVGVGASTLISVKLGQKDYDTAHKILGNVVSLNFIIGIAFTIISLIFLDPILYFFGASDATLPYARDYMITICWATSSPTCIWASTRYSDLPDIRKKPCWLPSLPWLSIQYSTPSSSTDSVGESGERPSLPSWHKYCRLSGCSRYSATRKNCCICTGAFTA